MRIFFRTSLIAVISFSLFYLSVDQINGRVSSAVTDFSDSHESTKKASTAMRFVTWRAAMKILKNNPYGIGVGNWRMAFKKEYLAMGELEAAEKPLPAHNAFLQIGVEWGYFGFFLLCFIVVLNIYYSFQSKSLFFWVFSILFPVNFLFESMLELQQGIVLFTFLTLILGFRNYSQGFPAQIS
jgi:O-antigen ligase